MGKGQYTGGEAGSDLLGQGNIPNMSFTNVEGFDLLVRSRWEREGERVTWREVFERMRQ